MKYLFLYLLFWTPFCWGQKMTGFWQGMLFSPNDQTVLIPVYLDIFVTNGLIDGKIRIENKEGASVYPVVGKYENDEMQLLLRSLQAFIRSPFLENQSIAGTVLHRELTLNLCQKLFSIK